MPKPRGLGKGLDALFQENAGANGESAPVTLRLSEVVPNRSQPRKSFDDEALAELADSIKRHGVLQPLLVRPLTDGSYQLVAGERRWRASRLAGLTEVPVVIREMSERDVAEVALIENLQREDLTPLEEARGYRSLMEEYKLTQEEVAAIVGKSRPAVTNALRLLKLPDEVASQVEAGHLSAGAARALLAVDNPVAQTAAAAKAIEQGLSVREVERLVKTLAATQNASSSPKKSPSESQKSPTFERDPFFTEVELSLAEYLHRKVKINDGASGGGTLILEFYGKDDLQEIARALAGEG